MKLDILAVGAHPDDIELCCAGTLASLRARGYRTGIIDLTEGELGTRGTRAIRLKEASAAAKILGCVRENLGLPDGGIDTGRESILKLIRCYRKYRPEILLIPHAQERHPDHVHAHHLAREAWFYSGLRKIPTRLNGQTQEPWRPKNYFCYMQWETFTPTFIVDITDSYALREKAIRAHKSQFFDPKSKDPKTILSEKWFLDMVESRAKFYGEEIGVRFGEPFYSTEAIGIENLFHLKLFHG
jgi:bacillithiol biosynthesis deacetylase BshB1